MGRVESPGNIKGAHPRTFGSVVTKCRKLCHGAGNDNLARAVDICRSKAVLLRFCKNFFGVATKYRGHPGFGNRRRRGHCLATLAHENHGLLGRQHPGAHRGGNFTDGMPRSGADLGESG